MEKKTKARSGTRGSKLNRSETVTMRLDPKLRYLTELAARKQRRTVSSFIEWAIEHSLKDIILYEDYNYPGDPNKITLSQEAQTLWDTDESDRIAKLALTYPELLTYDEQIVWKVIKECGYLWKGKFDKQGYWTWELKPESLIFSRLRESWDIFKQVANGEADKSELPSWDEYKTQTLGTKDIVPPPDDDDLPF